MAKANLYANVKVARDKDLVEQIGRDTYFDLVDHDKVRCFHINIQTPFNNLKKQVAVEFGIPVQFQRFWLWEKRINNTYRPHRIVTRQQEALPVGNLIKQSHENAELNLFLEMELGQGLQPICPPVKSADDILLFFKLYDPLKEELRYVGRLYVKANGMPVDFLAKINGLAGFAPDEDIILYEETAFEPEVVWYLVDKMVTFRVNQLEDGDIICFQKSPLVESTGLCDHPFVSSFLEYVHHNQEQVSTCSSLSSLDNCCSDIVSHEFKPEDHRKYRSELKPTGKGQGTNSGGSTTQIHSANVPDDKVRFLVYWVSSEASLILERIQSIHEGTFTKFSMKGQKMQTGLLELFASFVESISTTKVNEVLEDVLRQAALSIEDFEQVGLELSWLKKRLEEAKKANKRAESLIYVDLCETALKVGRAKVLELEEGLVKAKAELENWSTDLPNSLGVNDYLLMDMV